MENGLIRILQLEDSEVDAELCRAELERAGLRFEWRREQTAEGFKAGLRDFRPDIVLCDYSLPSYDGVNALRALRDRSVDLPFIFVTGSMGEDLAVECLKNGATDFVVKNSLSRLPVAVRRALLEAAAAGEQAALRVDQAALIEALGEIVYDWRPKTDAVRWGGQFQRILGYSAGEIGRDTASWTGRVHPDDLAAVLAEVESARSEKRLYDKVYRFRRADGTYAHVHDRGVLTLDAEGNLERIRGVLIDFTEQFRLVEQFQQAQKMEAIGRLAGGVAHDFNNILTSILGFSGFLLTSLPEGDRRRDDAAEIQAAARRAAVLTRQLLVFSRQKAFEREVLDASVAVSELMKMLRRIIGEDVTLDFRPSREACYVSVAAGQLEQVIVNLVVNARDAMPSGGSIVVATGRVALGGEAATLDPNLKPGPYTVLSVSDTGHGMDEGTLKRIFEPFFTTKAAGIGTGLGLSTVYGIVRECGGAVTVDSAPGQGATFKVWLPDAAEPPPPGPAEAARQSVTRGKETILILEDDLQIRKLLARALGSNGYRILTAATSREALDICARERDIDLLLSDVILSEAVRGPEVARRLRALAPRMRVMFMSGYTDERAAQEESTPLADAFVQKPIVPDDLALKIRGVFDSPPRAADGTVP